MPLLRDFTVVWQKNIFNLKLSVTPCDTAGCTDGCSVDGDIAVCNCQSDPLLKLDVDGKTCGKYNNIGEYEYCGYE